MLGSWNFHRYDKVSQENGEWIEGDKTARTTPMPESQVRQKHITYLTLLLSILLITSSVLVFRYTKTAQQNSCGDNPTTARERGCFFDIITFSWQMPECYDAPLVNEFANWQPWTFWTDESGNETVSLAEARKGEKTLWLPWQYHVVHCTFVWRQMHRAYETGWIDEHSRSYHHTTHCQKMLLMDCNDEGRFCILPNDTVVTSADLIYPACDKIDRARLSPWDGFVIEGEGSYV